jgi:hypothetical protein
MRQQHVDALHCDDPLSTSGPCTQASDCCCGFGM